MENDWQTEIIPMKKRNEYLLKTGIRSDCSFLVGVIPEERRLFRTHKFILSNASIVFERMFYGSLPPKDDEPVVICDVEADDFENLLHYIYTEDLCIRESVDKAQQLYYAANKYMLSQLMRKCVEILKENVTVQNVCEIVEFSKQFDETALETECMKIIKNETDEVLVYSSLLHANVSTLDTILSQDFLNINSEILLFEALERYADFRFPIQKRIKSTCKKCEDREVSLTEINKNDNNSEDCEVADGIPSSSSSDETKKSKKKDKYDLPTPSREQIEDMAYFRNVIKKIRFLTLTAQEFAKGPALSKLLSERDALALFVCITDPSLVKDNMPQGFSDLTTKRIIVSE